MAIDSGYASIDTTVMPMFGEYQGAVPGPNPKYHGRPSYHPIVARCAETGTTPLSRNGPGLLTKSGPPAHRAPRVLECSGASRVSLASLGGCAALDPPCALQVLEIVGDGQTDASGGAPGSRCRQRSQPAAFWGLPPDGDQRGDWMTHALGFSV